MCAWARVCVCACVRMGVGVGVREGATAAGPDQGAQVLGSGEAVIAALDHGEVHVPALQPVHHFLGHKRRHDAVLGAMEDAHGASHLRRFRTLPPLSCRNYISHGAIEKQQWAE